MKKLMLAAVTAAVVGGAFAEPFVYDYKASVKHLYLKEVPVKIKSGNIVTFDGIVYQKVAKSSILQGYLIMDADGVTSPTIRAGRGDATLAAYLMGLKVKIGGTEEEPEYDFTNNGFDYGRNRGFLVVINRSIDKSEVKEGVQHAKILPAVLDAKWMDTAFTKNHTASSGLAEGTLYVGGDAIAPVREQIDDLKALTSKTPRLVGRGYYPYLPTEPNWTETYQVTNPDDQADPPVTVGTVDWVKAWTQLPKSGMVAIADYVWTSVYLFGQYNGPNWFANALDGSPFGQFEHVWDNYLPLTLQTGWYQQYRLIDVDNEGVVTKDAEFLPSWRKAVNNYFHDTWMNGTGVGKYMKPANKTSGKRCCGIKPTLNTYDRILDTLNGYLKGGLFICTENGIDADPDNDYYKWWDDTAWEDQFNTARLTDGSGLFGLDVWQNDLWQDGFIEQETTDVIFGTWSLKYNAKFLSSKKEGGKVVELPEAFEKKYWTNYAGNYKNLLFGETMLTDKDIWLAIYSAAVALDPKVNFFDGSEIYNYTADYRFDIPMITPQFATYYRLFTTRPTRESEAGLETATKTVRMETF